MFLSIFPSTWKKRLNWWCWCLRCLSAHSLESTELWLSRASSMTGPSAKQYSAVFKLFHITFTQDTAIHLECSAAAPVPSDMPVPRRLEFTACTVGRGQEWSWSSRSKARNSPTKILSSPITFYPLCFFLLLQNSYRAVYFPHAAEFIWAISFLLSALLFWLLVESRKAKMPWEKLLSQHFKHC